MRVIAGAARRTVLLAPEGHNTRPTADRVKENLFNIISPYVPGARFLDLYCGSGAIGIEALSRGAGEAVFVDASKDAIRVTNANLSRARLTGLALTMCAIAAITRLEHEGFSFDIVFLDPPYGMGLISRTLDALGKSPLITPKSLVIAECPANEHPKMAEPLILQDVRDYGSTRLMFLST